MQVPYHSSTTALVDSTERLNRTPNPYEQFHRSGSGRKVPLDSNPAEWDGYVKAYSRDRDSGLVNMRLLCSLKSTQLLEAKKFTISDGCHSRVVPNINFSVKLNLIQTD